VPRRARTLRRQALAALVVAGGLALAFALLRYAHLDNRVLRWTHGLAPGNEWNRSRWRGASLWLPGYEYDIYARQVDVDDNLSGLDYDEENGRLLAVVNRPAQLLVLDERGRVRQRHRLRGASDVEAVAWLGHDRVALLQEGRRSILVVELPRADGQDIHVQDARTIPLVLDAGGNDGPEGLAYDAAGDVLYIAKERDPTALYTLHGVLGKGALRQEDRSDWLASLGFATDISSLDFDPRSRHLLLLSDESQLMAELDSDGRPVSWRPLATSGLHLPVPQAEGIAVDPRGTVYVVSEPNLFYRLRPATAVSGGRHAAP
jgi:uncharacterized protein YjiK